MALLDFLGKRTIAPAITVPSLRNDLIIDAGLHAGNDTRFYLAKGFRVVAIEASPELVREAEATFADDIRSGRLTIINAAIWSTPGTVDFYICPGKSDWGTVDRAFAERNRELSGQEQIVVPVRAITFDEVLRRSGIPYYLKIDLEGVDRLCLETLRSYEARPKHVSIEMSLTSFEDAFEELATLFSLGYRRFKIVNQSLNGRIVCPNPPREGVYVPATFDGYSSGPFGEEAPGEWMSIREALARATLIIDDQSKHGAKGSEYKTEASFHYRMYRDLIGDPVGWYDIHATR